MNGLGYTPICSSSALSKTNTFVHLRDYCALFRINLPYRMLLI